MINCVLILHKKKRYDKIYPIKVNNIDEVKNKIKKFVYDSGYQVKILEIFNKKFSNVELHNFEILTYEEWYNVVNK